MLQQLLNDLKIPLSRFVAIHELGGYDVRSFTGLNEPGNGNNDETHSMEFSQMEQLRFIIIVA